jgi:hypothetical protein
MPGCAPIRFVPSRTAPRVHVRTDSSHDGLQRQQDLLASGTKLRAMRKGNPPENSFSARRQMQKHSPPVRARARALQQAVRLEPVHEFHGAVMLDLQPLRQIAHRGVVAVGQALYGQEGLVLLRLDACGSNSLLAQILKSADFVTKIGKRLIVNSLFCSCIQGSEKLYRTAM